MSRGSDANKCTVVHMYRQVLDSVPFPTFAEPRPRQIDLLVAVSACPLTDNIVHHASGSLCEGGARKGHLVFSAKGGAPSYEQKRHATPNKAVTALRLYAAIKRVICCLPSQPEKVELFVRAPERIRVARTFSWEGTDKMETFLAPTLLEWKQKMAAKQDPDASANEDDSDDEGRESRGDRTFESDASGDKDASEDGKSSSGSADDGAEAKVAGIAEGAAGVDIK